MEAVIDILDARRIRCGCDQEYYLYGGEPMGIEEKLLVEVLDPITGEKYRKVVYWFRCLACGRLAKY